MLSGTPVQNAVRELLVLMHFLMPEVFAFGEEMDHFFSFLSGGSTDENDQTGLIKLRKTFAPFVLRRLKQDVLDQLTSKTTKVRTTHEEAVACGGQHQDSFHPQRC